MGLPRRILATEFARALVSAGIIRDDDFVRRIVIDAQADHAVMIYVERFGDERLLDIAMTLDGIQVITGKPPETAGKPEGTTTSPAATQSPSPTPTSPLSPSSPEGT